ncbi:MAG: molybdopterin-guanine dinucleotide biosynthesis protein B [Gammaproteobacteria bacterium]
MKVVGFCGASGSGKTTLLEGIVAALRRDGERASVIKHAHVGFDLDRPGKDSHRLREAGACEVLVASSKRLALLREFDVEALPDVRDLLGELAGTDWALVEGFKHAAIPKVEVWRAAVAAARGDAPLYPDDPWVIAVATDRPQALPVPPGRPVFALDDAPGLVAWLRTQGERLQLRPDVDRHD